MKPFAGDTAMVTSISPARRRLGGIASALFGGIIALHGCAKLEVDTEPAVVTITGAHSVLVGQTIALTAATTNGQDSSYTWESNSTNLATVSLSGVVTALNPGEAIITATGDNTGASATHVVVVTQAIPGGPNIPYWTAWQGSAHADSGSEAFVHWNSDGAIPADCARCHSTQGYRDYLGDDGSAIGSVQASAPTGGVLSCETCHNPTAQALTEVTFPSDNTVTDLGAEARCMVCHQGRTSGADVNQAIAEAAVGDDEPSTSLGFINNHYYAAAATLFAGVAEGGYQYDGQVYDVRFRHVPGYETCVGCHDPHSLRVKVDECATCHPGVTSVQDIRNVRMIASLGSDYDGDGDTLEGIYYEVQGLREKLLMAMDAYVKFAGVADICYARGYPYWFIDTNDDGDCQSEEATFANRFTQWTPRLLRAAYNYQASGNDPGGWAHNAKYLIQLLFDSISDLNAVLPIPVDMTQAVRTDPGHFNGASEAARHWDTDDALQASCAKCHGGSEGFRFYLLTGTNITVPEQANGLDCATCHDTFGTTFDVVSITSVTHPSGITLTGAAHPSNTCKTCHTGRASTTQIDAEINAATTEGRALRFQNVHYLPAAGVKAGTEAKLGYEYTGKTYSGEWTSHMGGNQCTSCHHPKDSNHSFTIESVFESRCSTCHGDVLTIDDYRPLSRAGIDYDGDGDDNEPLAMELATLGEKLLQAMQSHAENIVGTALCYDSHTHPYFFRDNDGGADGVCSSTEATRTNAFNQFDAALLKASHNYQVFQKEPGAWAHNFDYMAQLLIDSIEDLNGDLTGLVRPVP